MMRAFSALLLFLTITSIGTARAELIDLDVQDRQVVADGAEYGQYGEYEKLTGIATFTFDPENPANAAITDLSLGPKNAGGQVRARANFMVLQPLDPAKRRKLGLLEVSNRGGKAAIQYFNRASVRSRDPKSPVEFGDGFLMYEGLTLIWVGWQYDIPREDTAAWKDAMWLDAPVARHADGESIHGSVRSDWVIEKAVKSLSVGHRTLPAYYPVSDSTDKRNVLTLRQSREGERVTIARDTWRFSEDGKHIVHLGEGGFKPGIYELIYRAKDPAIGGIGLAVVRDMAAYAKHAPDSLFKVDLMMALGISQTGRFLRHFLYQGFNVDEEGRRALDGMLIHTAGAGRGSFNHRFGQPSRDAHRFSAFFYPTDLFPFTTAAQQDPATGKVDSLLDAYNDERMLPKIMATNTGYEYWGRAAALAHTRLSDGRDADLHPDERMYHLAGGQHFVPPFPPGVEQNRGEGAYTGAFVDFLPTLRALLSNLIEWVEVDALPPKSRIPSVRDRTLVAPADLAHLDIPGLSVPVTPHVAYAAEYGPRWPQGIVDLQPPALRGRFAPKVPQVDRFGNEQGGIISVELRVPLASYIPWSLRGRAPSASEIADFWGHTIPFPRTEAEKRATGDPRQSIERLHGNKAAFLEKVDAEIADLTREGFLLPGDNERVHARNEALWDWIHSLPPRNTRK